MMPFRTSIPLIFLFLSVLLTGGCAHQVVTRIEGQSAPTLPQQGQFSLSEVPEEDHPLLDKAHGYAIANLGQRGWRFAETDSAYQLVLTISERPAEIGLAAESESADNSRVIAEAKDKRSRNSCEDVEQRVTIVMLNQGNGETVYSGSAAEYHCEARLEDTLNTLVDAALEDFGRPGSQREIKRDGIH